MSLLLVILITLSYADPVAARALMGALKSPVSISAVVTPPPSTHCIALNSFGVLNSTFVSRVETFKALKIKPLPTAEMSISSLQLLKDAFMQATSLFKNNFDLDLESSPILIQTRTRLLAAVGYSEKLSDQKLKADLQKMSSLDLRWMGALQKMTCNLQTCKSQSDVTIAYEALIASKSFRKDIETALLEQAGEAISVDEMLGGRVIPSERARLRLFSALLNQMGVQNETRWGCSKSSGVFHFSSRLEVAIGTDLWASDTALASDYSQKAPRMCFSSLAQLTEMCLAKKGALL